MAVPCRHHPESESVGTCCYCDRPMCGECLLTNREGNTFCRREEECLAYQDSLTLPSGPASPITDGLLDPSTLDAQVERLTETLEELEAVKGALEAAAAATEEPASRLDADPGILGFCAWQLTEEAAALTALISLKVDFIRREQEVSGSSLLLDRAKELQAFLTQEAEPKTREYRDWAEPYGGVNVSRLLESFGHQDQTEEP